MKFIVITVNTNTLKSAKKIANALLGARAAVSVNFIQNVNSVYYWKGKINTAKEIMLLVKTSDGKYNKAEKIIKLNHPYEVPEILCFSTKASKETLRWLGSELK